MAYTHNFELEFDTVNIEGEMDFGDPPAFKTIAAEEMSIDQHRHVQGFFDKLVDFKRNCGNIALIKVEEKP